MSLAFVMPTAGPEVIARSPMEGQARAAGARFELRDGWNVAVQYSGPPSNTLGWADCSHLRTLELQGDPEAIAAAAGHELELGTATRHAGAWWCPMTPTRALVIGGADAIAGDGVDVVDVTSALAALTLIGPQARETLARFCALDLRPSRAPVCALRPGSVARQPGTVIREAEERYLMLFGWAIGEYMWTTVADAAERVRGRPLGFDQLPTLDAQEA